MTRIHAMLQSAWPLHAAGALLCLALAAGAYFLGLRPLIDRSRTAARQQAQVQALRGQSNEMKKRSTEIQARHLQVQKSLAETAIRLQPASRINRRLAELTQLAIQHQLKVDEIQPGKVRNLSRHEVMPIQIRGNGSYVACVHFLHAMRTSFPDTGTSLIDLKGAPDRPAAASTFEFQLDWYTAPSLATAQQVWE